MVMRKLFPWLFNGVMGLRVGDPSALGPAVLGQDLSQDFMWPLELQCM
jgi:hypothetical protein